MTEATMTARLAELGRRLEALERSPTAAALKVLGDELAALGDEAGELVDGPLGEQLEEAWAQYSRVEATVARTATLGSAEVVKTALEKNQPDALVALGSDEAFEAALGRALEEVKKKYWSTKTTWFFAAVSLATTPERRARAQAALAGALTGLVEARLAGGELVNAVAFGGLAAALGKLTPLSPPAREALVKALDFCRADACHYEAMWHAGTLAVSLALDGARDGLPAVEAFLERWKSNYRVNAGHRFMLGAVYAKCLLTGEPGAARELLADETQRGLGFVAATLADLHDRESIEPLRARLGGALKPAVKEALEEALARLTSQTAPPPPAERMIWLFGLVSPTEEALGKASDDAFVRRAKAQGATVRQPTETDERRPSER